MKGMGKGYGKMEKMMGKKDVEKKGSKADMKKDISIMMGVKVGKAPKSTVPPMGAKPAMPKGKMASTTKSMMPKPKKM